MARLEIGEIMGLILLKPRKFDDSRGFFSETYNRKSLAEAGFDREFVQDNHSLSVKACVLRGLHFQSPPYAQDKLVRVVHGAILDIAVDLRKSSPTYGHHAAVELNAENWHQLLVPVGFAHGFVTLQPNTEVVYKVTNYYAPDHDQGILWSDPALAINWQIRGEPHLSDKDELQPRLDQIENPFL